MRSVIVLATVFGLGACGKNQEPPPPTSGSPSAQPETGPQANTGGGGNTQARQMFETICATCHGIDGSGDGPVAANLPTKPRNYTDPKWQASISDDDLRKTILLGGQGVGKSPLMPGQPQLKDQPEVLDGLVQIVRGFGRK